MRKLAESGVVREKTSALLRTFWPSPQDYNEAVQNPHQSFADPELSASVPELDKFGIPRPHTGMFASVYKMQLAGATWALRFFLHNVPDQVERYSAIGAQLRRMNLSAFVYFDFQEHGLQLLGNSFPILKMNWCNGESLDRWIETNLTQTTKLEVFLNSWTNLMKSLASNGIAHGDLQHGNILIDSSGIRLIDYDGMFVPSLAGRQSNELGHRNYQHPQRAEVHFASYLDNFSAWLIYLSVKMIKLDPGLWWELRGGDDCLLFRAADLEDPFESDAFYILESHPTDEIRESSRLLRYLRSCRIEDVPPLGEAVVVPESFESIIADGSEDDTPESTAADGTHSDLTTPGPFLARGAKRRRSRKKGGAPGGRYFGVRTTLGSSSSTSSSSIRPSSSASSDSFDQSSLAGNIAGSGNSGDSTLATPQKNPEPAPAPSQNKKKVGDLLERMRPSQVMLYGAAQDSAPPSQNQGSASIAGGEAAQNPLETSGSNAGSNAISRKQLDTSWAAAVITLIIVVVVALVFIWMTKGNELSPLERLLTFARKSQPQNQSLLIYPVDWSRSKK